MNATPIKFLSIPVSPWGILGMLTTAWEKQQRLGCDLLSKSVDPQDVNTYLESVKSLEESGLVVTYDKSGMRCIKITKEGRNVSPTWPTTWDVDCNEIVNPSRAPIGVPFLTLSLPCTEGLIDLINPLMLSTNTDFAPRAHQALGKMASDSWKKITDAEYLGLAEGLSIVGWRYDDTACIVVNCNSRELLFRITGKAAVEIFAMAMLETSPNVVYVPAPEAVIAPAKPAAKPAAKSLSVGDLVEVTHNPYGALLPVPVGTEGVITNEGSEVVGVRFNNGTAVKCWVLTDGAGVNTLKAA